MTLLDFATTVYVPSRLDLSASSAEQLLIAVRLLDRWAARAVALDDLSPELLTRWLRALGDQGRAARTVNGKRQSILTLWRAAARQRMAPPLIDSTEVPSRRQPKLVPRAWTINELERLLFQCSRLEGRMRICPSVTRADYWSSLILVQYDTGARIGAVLAVSPDQVDIDGRTILLGASTSKTKTEQLVAISDQTAMAISRIHDPSRPKVWPCGKWRHELYRRLKSLLVAAGLPTDRKSKFHRLRKTNASHTAASGSVEMAQRQLGHTSARMTWDSYLDPRIVQRQQAVSVLPRPVVASQPVLRLRVAQ